jgi:hypothetical protein
VALCDDDDAALQRYCVGQRASEMVVISDPVLILDRPPLPVGVHSQHIQRPPAGDRNFGRFERKIAQANVRAKNVQVFAEPRGEVASLPGPYGTDVDTLKFVWACL